MYTQVCGVRGVQLEGSGSMLFSDDTKELQSTFDTWAYHAQDNAGMRNVRCYLCFVSGWVLAALMGCGVGMQKNLRPAACFCGMQSVYDVSLRMRQRAVLTSCFVLRAALYSELCVQCLALNATAWMMALRCSGGAMSNANCKLWACHFRQQHRVL